MSLFGLDLAQKGLSLYTIPAAFMLAMAPHAYASTSSGKTYDLAYPRKLQTTIVSDDKVDKVTKARILRGEAAAANAFETLGFFSAAVVAANTAGVDPRSVNLLSLGYIGCRILYNIIYVRLQDNRSWAPVRSLVWIASIGAVFTLYFKAAAQLAASS
ncbi:hypothetical protein CPLU01_01669 [Colletotrichum plurivorum]|uniref:MAPEG family protein n=2 Tax=Colletotrichum orchidearum species complex TaxID=2707337 RepID=A0A8H6NNT7_9PEZI|nr:hypothetical protein CSOJ01_08269 [Colletotrichum sojae]KAF6839797.1 hypothetical protein CPLU01_01669 [Colletotrichum plurivorum]